MNGTHAAPLAAPLAIRLVEAFVYRAPIERPVANSFGVMHDRPMVLVRLTAQDGRQGWGEIWCNFPTCGAEHRARLVATVFAPLLTGQSFASPAAMFAMLTQATRVLAIQSGEAGPVAQCIAGLDIAAWDLAARNAGLPLWRMLGGASGRVGVYASGLSAADAVEVALGKHAAGYRAFKLKVGFGQTRDTAALQALRDALGAGVRLMVDANQGWDVASALAILPALSPFDLGWIEEPVPADTPWREWFALAEAAPAPLAAGENIAGEAAFGAAIRSGALGVVQPDLAKWGGFSGCLPVAREAMMSGRRFYPHYLGGGVGLLAAGHLLAAAGGGGMLEVDANPNPLRECLMGSLAEVQDGAVDLPAGDGLGLPADMAVLAEWQVVA